MMWYRSRIAWSRQHSGAAHRGLRRRQVRKRLPAQSRPGCWFLHHRTKLKAAGRGNVPHSVAGRVVEACAPDLALDTRDACRLVVKTRWDIRQR